ncbi:C-type lectin domain family 4 member G [Suncus etruscus]|uniref:C-type lectin domain family 4 member G n=1 Tax=Suncus etruscus TaxID=109475 RepID=UPI0021100F2B|nr:C-type lectin domain family 4 member G [Suncus etruscus]XP_049645416.1 C-type lectin domain family 4 member G [Suncus etruscus]
MDSTSYFKWSEGYQKCPSGHCRCWGQRLLILAATFVTTIVLWVLALSVLSSWASSERGALLSRQDQQVTNASKLTVLVDDLKAEHKTYNSSCLSMQVQLRMTRTQLQEAQGKLLEQERSLGELKEQVTRSLAEAEKARDNIRTELLQAIRQNCSCPESWLHFQGSCYFFSQQTAQWGKAQEQCDRQGAHLVIVQNLIEQTFLTSNKGNFGYWLGLKAVRKDNKVQSYQWVDGVQLSFSYWNRGEPNDSKGREDCVMMVPPGKWNDAPCDNERDRWICEKPQLC